MALLSDLLFSPLSGPLAISATLITLAYLAYTHLLYPAFLSPLSRIPNAHWSVSFSPWWITWKRFQRRGNRTIEAAHVAHGPVVRLGPKEVSVNCVDGGVRTVYAGGFEKHEWYPRVFGSYGTVSMFTMVGSKPHSARKRMLSNLYSKSYLQKSPHLAAVSRTIILDRLLPSIASSARAGTTIEAHGFNNATTMDFITGYIFGLEAAPNFLEHPAEANSWLHAYQCRKPYEFYHQEVPRLTAIACAIGFPLVPKWCDEANQQMEDWGMELCKRADENIGMTEPGAEPLVYRQLKQALQKRIECMSDPEAAKEAAAHLPNDVACELFDQYTAGHETSAVALTYLYWELSRQPALQTALRDELKTPTLNIRPRERNGDRQLPDPKQLDSLPLLDAILTETLRLHAPIPGQQPRVTPAPSTKLGPYEHVPPSIRVGAQAYSLHRNEEVFPEPEAFCPGRWLREKEGGDAGDTELEQRRRWFWAFGSGGRMCIGSNLALQEIKLVVAAVYSNYTTTIVDDNDIEAVDAYTVGPTGNKLVLKFKQVYAE